jgi:hypothetical protein
MSPLCNVRREVLLVVHQFLQLEGYSSAAEALINDIPGATLNQDRCAAFPAEAAHLSGPDRASGLQL